MVVDRVGAVGLSARCCCMGEVSTTTPGRHLGRDSVLLFPTILSDYGGVCTRRHLWLWIVLVLSAFPPAAVWGIINYLWNTGTGAPLSAWTIVIVFYYPIQLWYSQYSGINVLVGVVGAVGLSARCCMGDNQLSLEHRHRGTSIGVDHCNCFLLSYPTMV